VKIRKR